VLKHFAHNSNFDNSFSFFLFQLCTPANTPATPPNFPDALAAFAKLSASDKYGTSPGMLSLRNIIIMFQKKEIPCSRLLVVLCAPLLYRVGNTRAKREKERVVCRRLYFGRSRASLDSLSILGHASFNSFVCRKCFSFLKKEEEENLPLKNRLFSLSTRIQGSIRHHRTRQRPTSPPSTCTATVPNRCLCSPNSINSKPVIGRLRCDRLYFVFSSFCFSLVGMSTKNHHPHADIIHLIIAKRVSKEQK
jgi:hypothetical protein